MTAKLENVVTGEEFGIADFKGKTVVLETFAVWCPKCTAQQKEIKTLRERGDDSVHITLNTDPNEDNERVLEHINRHGFDWPYAVASAQLTQQLVDEFGFAVVNAPGMPVILICEDQSSRLLQRGIKSAADLEREIAAGC